jgi:hypothetical protein
MDWQDIFYNKTKFQYHISRGTGTLPALSNIDKLLAMLKKIETPADKPS